MSTTHTPKQLGSKNDFRPVHRLLEEATRMNREVPGSGLPKLVEAKKLFDRFEFRGLVVARQAARRFELAGL